MKITAIMPTRGRPLFMLGAVQSYVRLASDKHEINLVLCCDLDDSMTCAAAFELRGSFPGVNVRGYERLPALGSYYNDACKHYPADAYCAIGDDTMCLSPDWDEAIAKQVEAEPNGVWWWSCHGKRQAIYPILSHGWYRAAGRFFSDLYPFWFDDTHLREIACMVWGKEVERVPGALLIDMAAEMRTHRMRDLEFWDGFYNASRVSRALEAKRIAERLGVADHVARILPVVARQHVGFQSIADKTEDIQGDREEPGPAYIAAKERAERYLARLALFREKQAA